MEVFSKSYLEEVVENQGKLFEYAEEHYPGIDVADFIESYMKSYTRWKNGRRICSKLDWTVLCIISMDIPTTKQRSR